MGAFLQGKRYFIGWRVRKGSSWITEEMPWSVIKFLFECLPLLSSSNSDCWLVTHVLSLMGSFLLWPQARSACISHHGRIQAALPILTVSRHFHVQVGRGGNWAPRTSCSSALASCAPLLASGRSARRVRVAQPRVCLRSVPGSHTRCPRDSWVGAPLCAPTASTSHTRQGEALGHAGDCASRRPRCHPAAGCEMSPKWTT